MELKDIKSLIDLMKKNDLTELRIERQDFKIALKRGIETVIPAIVPQVYAPAAAPHLAAASAPVGESAPAAAPPSGKEIVSPMVGTFYLTPSPESPAYAEIGTVVTPDTVVCIIEAMKVMNEIKAEVSGTITEILAENGKPVQFGQPLFRVK